MEIPGTLGCGTLMKILTCFQKSILPWNLFHMHTGNLIRWTVVKRPPYWFQPYWWTFSNYWYLANWRESVLLPFSTVLEAQLAEGFHVKSSIQRLLLDPLQNYNTALFDRSVYRIWIFVKFHFNSRGTGGKMKREIYCRAIKRTKLEILFSFWVSSFLNWKSWISASLLYHTGTMSHFVLCISLFVILVLFFSNWKKRNVRVQNFPSEHFLSEQT